MNNEQIKEIALANSFKLKEQPNGEMDLNPYVYEFARAIAVSKLDEAANDINDLEDFARNPDGFNMRLSCMGRVDDIINEIKEVADDK